VTNYVDDKLMMATPEHSLPLWSSYEVRVLWLAL